MKPSVEYRIDDRNVKKGGATIVGLKWISPSGALLVGICVVFLMLLVWITSPEKLAVSGAGYLAGMFTELAIISGVLGLALLIVNVGRRLCRLYFFRKSVSRS